MASTNFFGEGRPASANPRRQPGGGQAPRETCAAPGGRLPTPRL